MLCFSCCNPVCWYRWLAENILDSYSDLKSEIIYFSEADSDEISLPFGRTVNRQSASTIQTPQQNFVGGSSNPKLWQPNSGTVLDQDQDFEDWDHSIRSQRLVYYWFGSAQCGRRHWAVNYTCPQSFIITFCLFIW